jgi:hypothetical protein
MCWLNSGRFLYYPCFLLIHGKPWGNIKLIISQVFSQFWVKPANYCLVELEGHSPFLYCGCQLEGHRGSDRVVGNQTCLSSPVQDLVLAKQ